MSRRTPAGRGRPLSTLVPGARRRAPTRSLPPPPSRSPARSRGPPFPTPLDLDAQLVHVAVEVDAHRRPAVVAPARPRAAEAQLAVGAHLLTRGRRPAADEVLGQQLRL